jgi:hypothetical protein
MKKGFLLLISCCLLCIISASGQVNNNQVNHASDTLDALAFRQLVNFISTDTQNVKLEEAEKNSIPHQGEEHILVTPIPTYPGSSTEMANRFSYDNFLPTVYHKEPTQGSPFLLFLYVPGLVVSNTYKIINQQGNLYNYDKVTGNLLLKRNNESPIAVNREQVNSFALKIDKGGLIFTRVPVINYNEFYQVIYKGPKYSTYKLYKNKFVNANQKTNGYVSEGKDYDEYEDIITYYLVDEKKGASNMFELTRKSIRKVFSEAGPTAEQYVKAHKDEDITEPYVAHLTDELNK